MRTTETLTDRDRQVVRFILEHDPAGGMALEDGEARVQFYDSLEETMRRVNQLSLGDLAELKRELKT